jgi:hypothetical protein
MPATPEAFDQNAEKMSLSVPDAISGVVERFNSAQDASIGRGGTCEA